MQTIKSIKSLFILKDDDEEVDESEEQKVFEEKNETKSEKITDLKDELKTDFKKATQMGKRPDLGELYNEKAVLHQLVYPKFGQTKTTMGLFAVLTGKFKGQSLGVPNSRMTAWGYNLEKANLVLNLQYGEECTIEFR